MYMTEILNAQSKIAFTEKEEGIITRVIDAVFRERAMPPAGVSVLITDDEGIAELNRGYRGKDAPTDTLSFPLEEQDELGDIVISLERAAAQAKEYGHSPDREIAFLSAHSMLHLLGFDHQTPEEEAEMFGLQEKILNTLGFKR